MVFVSTSLREKVYSKKEEEDKRQLIQDARIQIQEYENEMQCHFEYKTII